MTMTSENDGRRGCCLLFATNAGCQLLVDRIVVYCTTVDILRVARCSRFLYNACQQPRIWRSLLATEWALDVAALERMHHRSLLRSQRFVPPNVLGVLNEEEEEGEEHGVRQQAASTRQQRGGSDDDADGSGAEEPQPRTPIVPATDAGANARSSALLPHSESPQPQPQAIVVGSGTTTTPPRHIVDRRRLPLSPAATPMRLGLDSATPSHQNTPLRAGSHSVVATPASASPPLPFFGGAASSSVARRGTSCSQSPVSEKLLRAPPQYDWKALLQFIHKRRVSNWQVVLDSLFENLLSTFFSSPSCSPELRSIDWTVLRANLACLGPCERRHRLACSTLSTGAADLAAAAAVAAQNGDAAAPSRCAFGLCLGDDPSAVLQRFAKMPSHELERKIAAMDNVIEAQVQSGVARGQLHHRLCLVTDLLLMAQMQLVLAQRQFAASRGAEDAVVAAAGSGPRRHRRRPVPEVAAATPSAASTTAVLPIVPLLAVCPARDLAEAGGPTAVSVRERTDDALLVMLPPPPSTPPPLPLQGDRAATAASADASRRYVALLGAAHDVDDDTHVTDPRRGSHPRQRRHPWTAALSSSTSSAPTLSSSSSVSASATASSDDDAAGDGDNERDKGGSQQRGSGAPASLVLEEQQLAVCGAANELTQRALGDLAMALLLLYPNNGSGNNTAPRAGAHANRDTESASADAEQALYQAAHSLAAQCTLALGSFPFSSPTFDLDQAYDQVQMTGTLKQRAAFLFRAELWRGPTFTLKMQQYSVCDCLKLWPERLMRQAKQCSATDAERLCSEAWLLFDRQDVEGAQRVIELATSLVRACHCHTRVDPAPPVVLQSQLRAGTERDPSSSSSADTSTVSTSTPHQLDSSTAVRSPTRANDGSGGSSSAVIRLPSQVLVPSSVRANVLPAAAAAAAAGIAVSTPSPFLSNPLPTTVTTSSDEGGVSDCHDNSGSGGKDDPYVCTRCHKPVTLPASLSFVCFSSGFISQQTPADAIGMYLTALRGCGEPGRRAITCNNIGTIYHQLKEYRVAAAWHEAAIACNSSYFLPYRNLARCYNAMGDVPRALSTILAAIRDCRPLPAEAFAERSKYAASSHQYTADVSMRVCPRLSYPYRLSAALLMDAGAHESALARLTDVIDMKLDPSDLSLRAVFHKDARRVDRAVADMQLALTLDPTGSTFLKWLERYAPADADLLCYSFAP